MKKLLTLFCLLMILVSCSKKQEVTNPMEKHDSLDEINEITHGNIQKPAVMGISDEEFYIINVGEDKIAQYTFKVAGISYTIRFSDTILDKDISGVYINGKEAFPTTDITNTKGEGLLLARWFTVDGQYVMSGDDSVEEETFNNVVEEMTTLTANR